MVGKILMKNPHKRICNLGNLPHISTLTPWGYKESTEVSVGEEESRTRLGRPSVPLIRREA